MDWQTYILKTIFLIMSNQQNNVLHGFLGHLISAVIGAVVILVTAQRINSSWSVLIIGFIFGFSLSLAIMFWNKSRWDKKYRKLSSQYKSLSKDNESYWKNKYDNLTARVTRWHANNYNILVDGAKNSGKSAIVSKWANPAVDISKLSPSAGLSQIPVYLCSRFYSKDGKHLEERYQLKFHDVPGEHEELIVDIITEHGVDFILLVIDPTEPDTSFQRFNRTYLKSLYVSNKVRERVNRLIIYISKSDIASKENLENVHRLIDTEIVKPLSAWYDPYIFCGSALDGSGLTETLGFIVKQVGIEKYYVKHESLMD